MKTNNPILYFLILFLFCSTWLDAQETFFSAERKFTTLLDSKLLKTGELVLIEERNFCSNLNVKLLNSSNGPGESLLETGRAVFFAFNELPNNNWALTIISNPADDVPVPFTFHTILFEDGEITTYHSDDEQTLIDLPAITKSAVVNGNELVLTGSNKVYFTDFTLSALETVTLHNSLNIMKAYQPDSSYLYFRYTDEDMISYTVDRFETEGFLASNLGPEFGDIHYIGNYIIGQDDTEIWALEGLFNFFYIENDKEIYNFRQQGQSLTYHTISPDSILTFTRIYLDANEKVQTESFDMDLMQVPPIDNLHWDANFKGYSYSFIPLPEDQFEDDYRGINYALMYDTVNIDFSGQFLDVSIDDIQYSTQVDTTMVAPDIYVFYADIEMEITLSNHSEEAVEDVHLYSAAFEGINCAHNYLRVDEDIIAIEAKGSKTVTARYTYLEFNSEKYLQHPLCVYVLGANNKIDPEFEDNVYCLPLSEFTSVDSEELLTTFEVFPNPAQHHIQIKSEVSNSEYLIIDAFGKKVNNWNRTSVQSNLDISNLQLGSYFILEKESNRIAFFQKI